MKLVTLKTIEQTLEQLTSPEKLALIEYIARSLQTRNAQSLSLESKCEALKRLRQQIIALPVAHLENGFSNRQHDELLYRNPS